MNRNLIVQTVNDGAKVYAIFESSKHIDKLTLASVCIYQFYFVMSTKKKPS